MAEDVPTYEDRLAALDTDARLDALVVACEPALVAWMTYALRVKPAYVDGVVGLKHVVDVDLPARALDEVRHRHDRPDVAATIHAYVEPIVSLQDGDFELSKRLEYGFYAIYNLHRLAFEPADSVTGMLVLNQAISALVDGDEDEKTDGALAAWWASWTALGR